MLAERGCAKECLHGAIWHSFWSNGLSIGEENATQCVCMATIYHTELAWELVDKNCTACNWSVTPSLQKNWTIRAPNLLPCERYIATSYNIHTRTYSAWTPYSSTSFEACAKIPASGWGFPSKCIGPLHHFLLFKLSILSFECFKVAWGIIKG